MPQTTDNASTANAKAPDRRIEQRSRVSTAVSRYARNRTFTPVTFFNAAPRNWLQGVSDRDGGSAYPTKRIIVRRGAKASPS